MSPRFLALSLVLTLCATAFVVLRAAGTPPARLRGLIRAACIGAVVGFFLGAAVEPRDAWPLMGRLAVGGAIFFYCVGVVIVAIAQAHDVGEARVRLHDLLATGREPEHPDITFPNREAAAQAFDRVTNSLAIRLVPAGPHEPSEVPIVEDLHELAGSEHLTYLVVPALSPLRRRRNDDGATILEPRIPAPALLLRLGLPRPQVTALAESEFSHRALKALRGEPEAPGEKRN